MAARVALSILALLLSLAPGAALADDWVAAKLRGRVFQLVEGQWQVLERGDIVPDDRVLRTTAGGRVQLNRGKETIDLGANTQIQIIDRAGRQFTNVTQYFGRVEIEAEVQNVEHFAVNTPFMAAVVKGTKFVVESGKQGSKVDVLRGRVAVESELTHSTTTIAAGQSASASGSAELMVAGKGELPMIVTANGVAHRASDLAAATLAKEAQRLSAAAARAVGKEKKAAEKAAAAALKAAQKAAQKASGKTESASSSAASGSSNASATGTETSSSSKSDNAGEKSDNSSGKSDNGNSGGNGNGKGKDKDK